MSRADYDDPLYRECIPSRPSRAPNTLLGPSVLPASYVYPDGPASEEAICALVDAVMPPEWNSHREAAA